MIKLLNAKRVRESRWGVMGFLKTIGLIIIALLFAASGATLIFVYSAQSSLFNPVFYSNALDQSNSYEQIREFIVDQMSSQMTGQIPDTSVGGVDLFDKQEFTSSVKTVLSESITTQWVKQQSNSLLVGVLGYINGDTNTLKAEISLAEPKANLKTRLADLLGGQATLDAIEEQGGSGLMDELPDTMDLTAQLNLRESDLQPLRDAKQQISTGLMAGGIITLVLAILIIALTRNLKGILRWIGAALALTGLYVLGLSQVVNAALNALASQPELPEIAIKLVNTLVSAIMSQATMIGIAALVIGVIGVIASFVVKTDASEPSPSKKSRKKQKEEDEEDEEEEEK